MDVPLAPRHTRGRIFATDWTIANVAKLLRFNAGQGILRAGPVTGGLRALNQEYLRKASARHLPSGVTVTFTREEAGNCWHAELCFADLYRYLPWNQHVAEEWLEALFPEDRASLIETIEAAAIHHYTLTP